METTRVLTRATDIPTDAEVPGLAAVLDPQKMRAAASATMTDRSAEIADCRIEYLRYKPETNCLVLYSLTWRNPHSKTSTTTRFYAKAFRPDDYSPVEAKAASGCRLETLHFPPVIPIADERTLLYFYPNDAELDGLRLTAEPKKIQRVLYEQLTYLPKSEWRISDRRLSLTMVRYKPEKRAVFRIDTRAVHRISGERQPLCVYLRTYADDRGEQVYAIMESLHSQLHGQEGITTPAPRGYIADRRTLLMDGLAGAPLTDCLQGDNGRRALRSTAHALARLHRAIDVPVAARSTEALLEEAEATGRFIARLVPDTLPKVNQVLGKLRDSSATLAGSGRDGFVHGDFYHGQVLIDGQVTALLDFDRSYLGDVLADVGNFGAHLQLLEQQNRIADAAGAFGTFVAEYEEAARIRIEDKHLRFWRTLGLLQLAVRPFRTLEADWRVRIRTTLADCLRLIS